ncbi:unnamed protein product [Lasius platythorax]|uniref:Uncharacterized protein n=1 Tax=Lasius platythorax TaxID=488582 RepID=A0AAV2NDD3_9HYME
MDPTESQQRTTDVDNNCILLPLVNMLNDFLQDPRKTIVEIDFLNKFPSPEVILPEVNFSPRRVIEYMMNTHTYTNYKIERRPCLLKTVTYKYRVRPPIVNYFIFSNNMFLAADIITICYIYHVILTRKYINLKVMQDLFDMMVRKYGIKPDNMMHLDRNAITRFNITYSFPSISFPLYGCEPDISKLSNFSHLMFTFPGLILSKILWCPMVALIIPRINSFLTPIAFLVAVIVKSNQFVKDCLKIPNYTGMTLSKIYHCFMALYFSDVFPKCLKLELCKRWGIIQEEQGEYKYADYFTTYRLKAIDIILELKSQDPELQSILSEEPFKINL